MTAVKESLSSQPEPKTSGERPPESPPLTWEEPTQPQLEFTPPPKPPPTRRMAGIGRQVCLVFLALLLSTISYYFISRFVVTSVVVQGKSMIPTLYDGDRCLLNRWAFRFRPPARGDVVVLKDPGHSDYAVKRVIGLPFDSIAFKDGDVYINGQRISEPYLTSQARTFSCDRKETLTLVGKERYFVLGDSRSNSEDSRFYGSIHRKDILGRINPPANNEISEVSKSRFQDFWEGALGASAVIASNFLIELANGGK